MARKMSKGRQKIQMKKMSKESNLLVTFSKRRSGLFKKASELCTLCGVEIAIVVFSPGRKVFSFGHPNVESIIDRFLMTRNNIPSATSSTTSQLVEAHRNANVRELNVQLMEIINQLEFEKKREVEIEKIRKAANIGKNWWEGPVNELGLGELEQLKLGMEELKKNVTKQMQKFILEASSSPAGLFLGGSFFNGGQVDDVKNIKGLGLSIATNRNTIFP